MRGPEAPGAQSFDPKPGRPALELSAIHQVTADAQHLMDIAQMAIRLAHLVVAELAQNHRFDGRHDNLVILDAPDDLVRGGT